MEKVLELLEGLLNYEGWNKQDKEEDGGEIEKVKKKVLCRTHFLYDLLFSHHLQNNDIVSVGKVGKNNNNNND